MISEDRKTIAIEAESLMKYGGLTQLETAAKMGKSVGEIAGCLRDWRKHRGTRRILQLPNVKRPNKPIYEELPIYGIAPNITENDIIDIGDPHFPEANYPFLDAMLAVAERRKRKTGRIALNIAGDICSQNAVSPHPASDRPMVFQREMEIAGAWLDKAAAIFDKIYILLGNHCYWLSKYTQGQLAPSDFLDLLLSHVASNKIEATTSTYTTIDSGGRRWLSTHTVQYQQTGRVASVLNSKHNIDILSHHEHQIGRGRDAWGRQNWINVGGGFDYNLQKYPHIFTTTRRVMQNSFVLLREGRPYEFAPYEAYGERWEDWGVNPSEMYAYEQQKRMINEFKLTEKEFAQMVESEAA